MMSKHDVKQMKVMEKNEDVSILLVFLGQRLRNWLLTEADLLDLM